MDYILKRSRRKSLSIRVTKEGEIEVYAPIRLPLSVIDKMVLSREDWILKHIEKMAFYQKKQEEFQLDEGKAVLILGEEYPICFSNAKEAFLEGQKMYLPHGSFLERKEALVNFYQKKAREILPERVRMFAAIMQLEVVEIKITSAKTRWGSCSSKNHLNFSWFLLMAPISAIDYVVIHELSHTVHHNHQKEFWELVERFCPRVQSEKQTLKNLARRLWEENW